MLISKNEILIYVSSIILGISSAVLWTAFGTYIIRITLKEHYGKASGLFNTVFSLMIALGMITLGIFLQNFSYEISYALILIPGIIGLLFLFKIKNIERNDKNDDIKEKETENINKSNRPNVMKEIFNRKMFKFFLLGTTVGLLFSLAIGYIPIDISKNFGEIYVGLIGALFYVIPIFLSYITGTISDKIGRINSFIILLSLIFVGLILIIGKFFLYGILIFAIAYSLTKVLLTPLIGDISNEKNLEGMNAFINTSLNLGVVIGLFLSLFVRNEIYVISLIFIVISILLLKKN